MTPLRTRRGAAWACLAVLAAAGPGRADLLDYVKKPEPAYAWKLKGKHDLPAGTVYDLQLVSQAWQGITWEHQLQVYQPKGVKPASTLLLWNQGGRASVGSMGFGLDLARKMNAPCAFLYGIPNQPLLGGKKEDALIAETFVRFLDSKDENWPLLFPMAKSVTRAMDAVQALADREGWAKIDRFLITGASKRGWTAWLTAAADARVVGIAPMVFDNLNFFAQMPHQIEVWGGYSEQIGDYTEQNLQEKMNTERGFHLTRVIDPYTYRDRLGLPKLIINGSNDRYWATDALNLYWDALLPPKWVLYVPNYGHSLEDYTRVFHACTAFTRAVAAGRALPHLEWSFAPSADSLRLTVTADTEAKEARIWVARAATKDFRASRWEAVPMRRESAPEGHAAALVGEVETPASGYLAAFGEVAFTQEEGRPFTLSTQPSIVGSR